MRSDWIRPANQHEARERLLRAEKTRNFEEAALCAITLSDIYFQEHPRDSESMERQALVYASLHQADTATWIAENRR